ncbi:MAG: hypothetical protein MMC33_002057 [Icmadophila ericetorum]|nr:hypothetical protein [Icmadophila ericetorum]
MPCRTADLIEVPQRPQILHKPLEAARNPKRKRGQEVGHSSFQGGDRLPSKRLGTSPSNCTAEERVASDVRKNSTEPIQYQICTGRWPKKYFEQDSQVREDLEQDSWLEEQMENLTQVVEYVEINGYRYPRPIGKLPTSLRWKQSDSSLNGSSDQQKRESKSAPYRDTRYNTLLATKGSFMNKSELDITMESKKLCQHLLELNQAAPKDSLFRDDLFEKTCQKIGDRNEARAIQDISRLIVPSAETLATYGATNLDHLIEGVNEGWVGSIAVEGPKPQPDYSVGFR